MANDDHYVPAGALAGWGYLFDEASGELLSEGRVFASPLPAGTALYEAAQRHDPETTQWDAAARRLVPYGDAERLGAARAQRDALNAQITKLETAAALADAVME